MKRWWLGVMVAASLAVGLAPMAVEAKRLGGGGSAGMQRSTPPRSTPDTPPAKPAAAPNQNQATPAQAAPAAAGAAAAPKRSWMGPIAGLAAGLGLAALMSHLGMGEAFGNFLMLALLAVVAVVAIRFLMRRLSGGPALKPAFAGAGAGAAAPAPSPWRTETPAMARTAEPAGAALPAGAMPGASGAAASSVPADFDAAGFARLAKQIFIRLQAANDHADLNDLRQFTTPELFAALRLDLQDRGDLAQQTDVVKIDAEVLEVVQDDGRQIVSVRFHGLIRELSDGAAADFDEVWHLVKPNDDSRPWAIAGIQQRQ